MLHMLYTILIHHLDYKLYVWSPCQVGDIRILEQVATKMCN